MRLRVGIVNGLLALILIAQGCKTNADPKPNPVKPPVNFEFAVANVLQSNMVVQRDKPFAVWGTGANGQNVQVAVSWHNGTYSGITDADGNWKVVIPPAPANTTAQTITIGADGEKTDTLSNILIGDIWICSGQSNMTMPLGAVSGSFRGALNYEREIPAAKYPLIRELTIKRNAQLSPVVMINEPQTWNICSPETAGNISAVAYFFARKVHAETGVPIGLVIASVNGTTCQLWANKEVYDDGGIRSLYGGGGSGSAELYNGMINPLVPLSIKGFLWYQGESNWGDDPAHYARLNAAMIKGWRDKFNQGMLPFYYVQLAPFAKNQNTQPNGGDLTLYDYALFREGQKGIAATTPYTAMAIAIDAGEILNLHPRNKKPIGERLALWALKNDYGKDVDPVCPAYQAYNQNGRVVTISFNNATALKTIEGKPLNQLFFVADDTRVFVNAPAAIQGNTINLSVPAGIGTVKAVRYAFTNAAVTNLLNSNNLPVEQFRTDNW